MYIMLKDDHGGDTITMGLGVETGPNDAFFGPI